MKKILSVALVAVLALSLAGCGAKDSGSTTSAAGGSTVAGDAAKHYVIATDTAFAPFEFTDASNEFVGIDVDIVSAIAEDQGFTVEMSSLGFDAALLAVEAGQADGVIAGMSITEERIAKFDFSDAYFEADVTMATAKDSGITKYEDLKGKNVAVKTATNGAAFGKSIAEQYGFTVTEFKDSPTMYQDVVAGNSAACFEDYPVMAYNIQQGAKLVMPGDLKESGSEYGFAVKKGQNAELIEKFNAGLKNIKDNGKYQEIVDKYTK